MQHHEAIAGEDVDGRPGVPAHRRLVFTEKRSPYALVIPILDEGERIRAQLRRIAQAGIAVDVIIADGGSRDGAVDDAIAKETGIRAILVKTGPGALGAQLRMAYDWCLDQGYDGIVTIDGNGKDGIAAIGDMIAKLREGYDYVQGSRYRPGGEAINTPFERTLGNRYLHAPLLSLAARFRYSDTTNGFRAYSARLLRDPQLALFRDVFSRYELLFHISAMAPRLGFRCIEIPVSRRYPDNGRVPTKITGFAGKAALLGQTLNAACGNYAPSGVAAPMRHAGLLFGFTVTTLIVLTLAIAWRAPPYSPDSFAYYALAQTLVTDFQRIGHLRSYWSEWYSAAFPPLWPALWAGIDALTGTAARAGLVGATLAAGAFATFTEAATRRLTGTRWLGLAIAVMILMHQGFLEEWSAARAVPLHMALLAGLLYLLAARPADHPGPALAGLLGLICGLAVMARFDALPFALAMALGLVVWTRSAFVLIAFVGALALAISPWIAYSLNTFGSPFVTDNGWVAVSVDSRAFVTDWPTGTGPTLFEAPLAWLLLALERLPMLFARAFGSAGTWPTIALVAMLLVLIGLLSLFYRGGAPRMALRKTPEWQRMEPVLVLLGFAIVAGWPAYLATGYIHGRYFTPFAWIGLLALFSALLLPLRAGRQREIVAGGLLIAALIAALAGLVRIERAAHGFPAYDGYARIAPCLSAQNPDAPVLVGNPVIAAQLDAVHDVRTGFVPRNIMRGDADAGDVASFITVHGFTHLYDPGAAARRVLPVREIGAEGPDCGPSWLRLRVPG